MEISTSNLFDKHFRKRIKPHKNLVNLFQKQISRFRDNPNHPLLRNHELKGEKQNLRSFSITGDIRVIYEHHSHDEVKFLDVGTHNQVY